MTNLMQTVSSRIGNEQSYSPAILASRRAASPQPIPPSPQFVLPPNHLERLYRPKRSVCRCPEGRCLRDRGSRNFRRHRLARGGELRSLRLPPVSQPGKQERTGRSIILDRLDEEELPSPVPDPAKVRQNLSEGRVGGSDVHGSGFGCI